MIFVQNDGVCRADSYTMRVVWVRGLWLEFWSVATCAVITIATSNIAFADIIQDLDEIIGGVSDIEHESAEEELLPGRKFEFHKVIIIVKTTLLSIHSLRNQVNLTI